MDGCAARRFGRFSIDYHYLRNALFVEQEMGEEQAERHVPAYARAIMDKYDAEMEELRTLKPKRGDGGGPIAHALAAVRRLLGVVDESEGAGGGPQSKA